ncbi:MAG: hypothetical protein ABI721_05875 [Candidatus Dojkabacteria bacterium]
MKKLFTKKGILILIGMVVLACCCLTSLAGAAIYLERDYLLDQGINIPAGWNTYNENGYHFGYPQSFTLKNLTVENKSNLEDFSDRISVGILPIGNLRVDLSDSESKLSNCDFIEKRFNNIYNHLPVPEGGTNSANNSGAMKELRINGRQVCRYTERVVETNYKTTQLIYVFIIEQQGVTKAILVSVSSGDNVTVEDKADMEKVVNTMKFDNNIEIKGWEDFFPQVGN